MAKVFKLKRFVVSINYLVSYFCGQVRVYVLKLDFKFIQNWLNGYHSFIIKINKLETIYFSWTNYVPNRFFRGIPYTVITSSTLYQTYYVSVLSLRFFFRCLRYYKHVSITHNNVPL